MGPPPSQTVPEKLLDDGFIQAPEVAAGSTEPPVKAPDQPNLETDSFWVIALAADQRSVGFNIRRQRASRLALDGSRRNECRIHPSRIAATTSGEQAGLCRIEQRPFRGKRTPDAA